MNTAHRSHVMVSEIWNKVQRNIIAANAKIARNAPCSRYLYFVNVHFLTSMSVRLLTNIAPIHSHNAMMKIFLLSAKAPITPSNEKLASKTSRYKNKDIQTLTILVISDLGLCNIVVMPSIAMNTIIHRRLAIRKVRCSAAGRNIPMMYATSMVITISMDLSAHIFCRRFSIYPSRCVSFSASRKKLSATKSKNVHQNPAIVICEAARMVA